MKSEMTSSFGNRLTRAVDAITQDLNHLPNIFSTKVLKQPLMESL